VLRRIFGLKREELAGDWRRLHSGELYNLHTSPNVIRVIQSRRMRWVVHVACVGEMREVYNILIGKHEGKRPVGRHRHRWENNSRTNLSEIRWEGVDWIHLAQDRDQWRALVNTVTNICARARARTHTANFFDMKIGIVVRTNKLINHYEILTEKQNNMHETSNFKCLKPCFV
jgi:hypothetical protein